MVVGLDGSRCGDCGVDDDKREPLIAVGDDANRSACGWAARTARANEDGCSTFRRAIVTYDGLRSLLISSASSAATPNRIARALRIVPACTEGGQSSHEAEVSLLCGA